MIKTGQVTNVVLGVGDSSKFNLLGGSFGQPGDAGMTAGGQGMRFLKRDRDRILSAAYGSTPSGGGGGTPTAPRRPGDWNPNRYVRER